MLFRLNNISNEYSYEFKIYRIKPRLQIPALTVLRSSNPARAFILFTFPFVLKTYLMDEYYKNGISKPMNVFSLICTFNFY